MGGSAHRTKQAFTAIIAREVRGTKALNVLETAASGAAGGGGEGQNKNIENNPMQSRSQPGARRS